MIAFGMVPGVDNGGGSFAPRWDKRDDYHPTEAVDAGWIGEDDEGVWMSRHPEAALSQHPHLFPVVAEWRRGNRELTERDYLTKSARDHLAKLVMVCASRREEVRRMRKPNNGS